MHRIRFFLEKYQNYKNKHFFYPAPLSTYKFFSFIDKIILKDFHVLENSKIEPYKK